MATPIFALRIPPNLKSKLEKSAKNSNRSISAEIIRRIVSSYALEEDFKVTLDKLEKRSYMLKKEMYLMKNVKSILEKKRDFFIQNEPVSEKDIPSVFNDKELTILEEAGKLTGKPAIQLILDFYGSTIKPNK